MPQRKSQQRSSLLTLYKTFIRSRLDYADVTYNSAFSDKLGSFQYNACLAITGRIRVLQQKKYTMT